MTISRWANHRSTAHPSSATIANGKLRNGCSMFSTTSSISPGRLRHARVAKCKNYFTPKQNALKQNWVKASGGEPIFCNPPYAWNQVGDWVKKGYEESQRGAVVVMLLPQYVSYPWFRYIVSQYAEIRQVQGLVAFKGFGENIGKGAGVTPRRNFDVIVAIFRPGQQESWSGPYVDRPGKQPPAPPKLAALKRSSNGHSSGPIAARHRPTAHADER